MTEQPKSSHTYTQGHSSHTTANHELRNAETDAAFLIPYIKPTDHILDVGCGPGTITTSFTKHAPQGSIIGIDISAPVLERARTLANESGIPTQGPGAVTFALGNILETLPYADSSFDIVYTSQVFGHLPVPDAPLRALSEIKRILKPNGIFASRDGVEQHFYPKRFDLDRLWGGNLMKSIYTGKTAPDPTGTMMQHLLRKAGFDVDGGKVRVGAAARVSVEPEKRRFLAARTKGQLQVGDPFRQSWLDAGIGEQEIEETVKAAHAWAETDDAWFLAVQCEVLAWK